ncbi:glyoxalase superfamily protein [Winogradskyella sp. PG-2]|uniref:glyoxalase superfamily protein n=1 Tax=Winogradskyella sp. PG-2 TaxID=754409 RepID=UPI0004589638|nr:glyoxalase/bleomycin resistance/extradiol dioxygenase family protein [Winogradskyella sp. PG-2]BAO74551.1 bleomycin resistance protein [Winogradskyella sp. PG-2]
MSGYLKQIHPVLPVKDVSKAVDYYVSKLGFQLAFRDATSVQGYAGVRRDSIEIHLQWHDSSELDNGLNTQMLRIYVDNIEALHEEFKTQDVFHDNTSLKETPWGTKEFAFYDLYKNGLTFYRDK